jgi:CheY-like chemotaxis protein
MATILIVDDSLVVQRTLRFTLQKSGHQVMSAGNGIQALKFLTYHTIDLVIADVTMPEMDGLSLLKEIRARHQYQQLPIVMLTASGESRDQKTAQQEGANSFLTKPISSRQLVETINQLLEQPVEI